MSQQTQIPVQVDLSKTTGFECGSCGCPFFDQTMLIRKISRLYTGSPEDQITFVPVMVCHDCGQPLKEFFPAGMSDVEAKLGYVRKEDTTTSPLFKIN